MKNKINDTVNCTVCEKPAILDKYYKVSKYNNHGRAYCSSECSKEYCRKVSSETMAKTNRKYASERMIKNNPMKNPETREKVSTKLRAMGHKPKIQGGNGRGHTIYQLALSMALGWPMEVVALTGEPKGNGIPTAYKIDIGNPILKIAIEVDGNSHTALIRQAQDKRKDNVLKNLGWKVLRFKNREVENDLHGCVKKVLDLI